MKSEARESQEKGWLRRWLQCLLRNQRGALLIETVVALAVFGVLGVAVLGAVQTSHITKRDFDIYSTTENLIRNQLEFVLEQPYKDPGQTYLSIVPPDGYSITAESLTYDVTSTDISTVRVTVYQDGQAVKVFDTIRTKR